MGFLTDWITNWLKELLIGGIMDNLSGLFDTVNARVGEIAVQVGTTPAAWNAGVFSLIRQLSETVILPIAGLVLTFVATYELIQMLLEKNNMHEVDVANLYKWMFKTACAVLILSNTFNIVIASVMYRVKAYDDAGLQSGWRTSSQVNVHNNTAPTVPENINVPNSIIGGEPLTITWGNQPILTVIQSAIF